MNEFLKMDVFFFITSVATILLTLFGTFVLWRFSRVLKNIEHISEQIALESDTIRADLAGVRADFFRGKRRLRSLVGFFTKTTKRIRDITPKESASVDRVAGTYQGTHAIDAADLKRATSKLETNLNALHREPKRIIRKNVSRVKTQAKHL